MQIGVRKDALQQLEHKVHVDETKACSGNQSDIATKDTPSKGTICHNLNKLKTLTYLHFFFRRKVFLISTMVMQILEKGRRFFLT